MKKLILLLILFTLFGCSKNINSWELQTASSFCKGYNNISLISTESIGYSWVTCNDGSESIIQQSNLKDVK